MGFLTTLFGSNKPTSTDVDTKLAEIEADLASMPTRLAEADKTLASVGDLTDEEHSAAEENAAGLRRLDDRLKDRRAKLIVARDRALADEAASDLVRRAGEAAKRVKAYRRLVIQCETESAALAATLAAMREAESAVDAVNREIDATRKAGLRAPERVATPAEVYLREPDVVEPDRTVIEDKVVYTETITSYDEDDNAGHEYRDVVVGITQRGADGKLKLGAGERVKKVERVIPGRTIYGKRIASPTENAVLPAVRVGGAKFWPRDE